MGGRIRIAWLVGIVASLASLTVGCVGSGTAAPGAATSHAVAGATQPTTAKSATAASLKVQVGQLTRELQTLRDEERRRAQDLDFRSWLNVRLKQVEDRLAPAAKPEEGTSIKDWSEVAKNLAESMKAVREAFPGNGEKSLAGSLQQALESIAERAGQVIAERMLARQPATEPALAELPADMKKLNDGIDRLDKSVAALQGRNTSAASGGGGLPTNSETWKVFLYLAIGAAVANALTRFGNLYMRRGEAKRISADVRQIKIRSEREMLELVRMNATIRRENAEADMAEARRDREKTAGAQSDALSQTPKGLERRVHWNMTARLPRTYLFLPIRAHPRNPRSESFVF